MSAETWRFIPVVSHLSPDAFPEENKHCDRYHQKRHRKHVIHKIPP
jgi:hypothetical protein